jgi:hypothetical protein
VANLSTLAGEPSIGGADTVSKKRTLAIVFVCGFIPLLVDAVVDRAWPDHSAQHWLVVLGGLVVIAVVAVVIDSLVARRQRSRGAEQA